MVWHKKDGRRKSSEESESGNQTLEEHEEERKANGRNRYWRIPQLEGKDLGSKAMEENHRRGKDEQGIRMGTKENVE